ncbi:hypothetical protein KC340_g9236 [Hortaea werneckii]|nr:hypothetical protein KC365_g11729 [Hortaea werneckii]KAI7314701.1 hypothetical protein KC340_g9236 [Hortaea werneckii]KAI7382056.1 hypothetical protein KC328_g11895 [Hortaea werneckii]
MAPAAANLPLADKDAMGRGSDDLQSLRNEVQEVIRPYTTADEEPPFSGGELIVMSLVDTDEESLPKDRILRWIVNTFKYYRDVFLDKAFQNLGPDFVFYDGSDGVVFEDIPKAFTEYELSIRESQVMVEKRSASHWSVTTQAARVYLRRWLEPEREGIFPFLDVPPEIRNNIYELIFTFPSSGIHVQEADERKGFDVFFLQRIDEPGPCGRKWSDSLFQGNPFVIKKSMNDILAPLCVNRQVYKEAMPLFYLLNTFHFDYYSFEVEKFPLAMPSSRFEHLRNLHLDLTDVIRERLVMSWSNITEALSGKAVGFTELRISMTDDAWLGRGWKARQLRNSISIVNILYFIRLLGLFAKLPTFHRTPHDTLSIVRINNSSTPTHQLIETEDQPTAIAPAVSSSCNAEVSSPALPKSQEDHVVQQDDMARESIREEILTLIEPFARSPDQPPFNEAELTMIVIIYSNTSALDRIGVFCWISKTFPYYNHQLIDTCAPCLRNKAEAGNYLQELLESRLGKPSKQYDVPLKGVYPEAPYDERLRFYTPIDFTVTPAGRTFLRRWLEPERKGTFPFLDLPAELRNEVYKLLFRFPEFGIKIHSLGEIGQEDDRVVMKVFSRIDGDKDPFDHVSKVPTNDVLWDIKPPPTSETLALLATNRQIYSETCPLFYSLNRFRFSSIRALHTVLTDPTQANRLQHIRSIEISLLRHFEHLDKFVPAMEALSTPLTGLKRLEIRITAGLWLTMNKRMRVKVGAGKEKFAGFGQIPGMSALALVASRVDEVIYTDEVEAGSFKAFLEDEMGRIRLRSGKDMVPKDLIEEH